MTDAQEKLLTALSEAMIIQLRSQAMLVSRLLGAEISPSAYDMRGQVLKAAVELDKAVRENEASS